MGKGVTLSKEEITELAKLLVGEAEMGL